MPKKSGTALEPLEDLMVLVQRGTSFPPHTGDLKDATIAVNNDGTLAFVQALNRTDAVSALGSLSIYEDALRQRGEAGEIGLIGYSWHSEPGLEVLLDRQPDIAFLTMEAPHNVKALGQARELGLSVASTFEWAETHYLADIIAWQSGVGGTYLDPNPHSPKLNCHAKELLIKPGVRY